MAKIAYLGPEGTFTHHAARGLAPKNDVLRPYSTAVTALDSVCSDECDSAVVALFNSIVGEIATNLDYLLFGVTDLIINAELVLPVSFDALGHADDSARTVGVVSHPAALSQCSEFIERRGLKSEDADSTAEACRLIASTKREGWCAIGPAIAGELYGLRTLASAIENTKGLATRFVLVAKHLDTDFLNEHPAPSDVRTAIAVFLPHVKIHMIGDVLGVLEKLRIHLFTLRSRPMREQFGATAYYMEFEGHVNSDEIRRFFEETAKMGLSVRFIGSYRQDRSFTPPSLSIESLHFHRDYEPFPGG